MEKGNGVRLVFQEGRHLEFMAKIGPEVPLPVCFGGGARNDAGAHGLVCNAEIKEESMAGCTGSMRQGCGCG